MPCWIYFEIHAKEKDNEWAVHFRKFYKAVGGRIYTMIQLMCHLHKSLCNRISHEKFCDAWTTYLVSLGDQFKIAIIYSQTDKLHIVLAKKKKKLKI